MDALRHLCLHPYCYLEVLLTCWRHLQDQQHAISAGLAGFVQPEPGAGLDEGLGGGDDEYDPEDADMQLGF